MAKPARTIFIGHGHSRVWEQLREYLTNTLHHKCIEFNTEVSPGTTTIEGLQSLLNQASFAFLVMTAEDIHPDKSLHARENVIHEAGLFQGRLGFERAIILLEDGCAQFSNIHGLKCISFPKGDLGPALLEAGRVLEREIMPRELGLPERFTPDYYGRLRARARIERRGTVNLAVQRVIVIHYVRESFQLGFRAYTGLSTRSGTEGSLPLYVTTSRNGSAKTVQYFWWSGGGGSPQVGSADAVDIDGNSGAVIAIESGAGYDNVSVFRYYEDPAFDPDFFHVNPFAIDDAGVDLHHYVVVESDDLDRWNPNKYLFQVDGTGVRVSPEVYRALSPACSLLVPAQEVLARFLETSRTYGMMKSMEETQQKHVDAVRAEVTKIFDGESFKPTVTVFRLRRNATETNLFLGYCFNPRIRF